MAEALGSRKSGSPDKLNYFNVAEEENLDELSAPPNPTNASHHVTLQIPDSQDTHEEKKGQKQSSAFIGKPPPFPVSDEESRSGNHFFPPQSTENLNPSLKAQMEGRGKANDLVYPPVASVSDSMSSSNESHTPPMGKGEEERRAPLCANPLGVTKDVQSPIHKEDGDIGKIQSAGQCRAHNSVHAQPKAPEKMEFRGLNLWGSPNKKPEQPYSQANSEHNPERSKHSHREENRPISDYRGHKRKAAERDEVLPLHVLEKIASDYPAVSRQYLHDMQKALVTVDKYYREVVLRNKCCMLQAIQGFAEKEEDNDVMIVNPKDFAQYEIPLHQKYLIKYKVQLCKAKNHTPECFDYHDTVKDRRRLPVLDCNSRWNYYPEKCKKSLCLSESCEYAHNQYEIDYHPLVYRTMLCSYADTDGYRCLALGERCNKAHGPKDLRDVNALLRKVRAANERQTNLGLVQPAPFRVDEFCVSECPNPIYCTTTDCMHFHNLLERRRNPKEFNYASKYCPFFIANKTSKGPLKCSQGDKCGFCHTKNEFIYHPLNYRMKPCKRKKCPYGARCPNRHLNMKIARKKVEERNLNWEAEIFEEKKQSPRRLRSTQDKVNMCTDSADCSGCKESKNFILQHLKDWLDQFCANSRFRSLVQYLITIKMDPKKLTRSSKGGVRFPKNLDRNSGRRHK